MENSISEWSNIEKFVGDEVPMFLKQLLWKCGYDSMISIKEISSDAIDNLEKHIQKNRNQILGEILLKLDDSGGNDHSLSEYKKQEVFEFIPGHHSILLSLPSKIKCMQLQTVNHATSGSDESTVLTSSELPVGYSVVLKKLLETADRNRNKSKNANQFDDDIKYFSTYIFLISSRTCYETLCKNLPIPSTKTICE